MAITDGQVASADEVMNSFGSVFNDVAQNLFAADYNGFDSRLHNSGTPNLYNTYYSTFKTNNADDYVGLIYDSTNDLYRTPDYSTEFYLIIEATSASSTALNWSSNNTLVSGTTNSGKWILSSTSASYEVQRAEVYKSLLYGTDGSNPLASEFTSVTAIKSSDSRDIGKKGYLFKSEVYPTNKGSASSADTIGESTLTLSDTTNNTDFSSWSRLQGIFASGTGSSYGINNYVSWEVPTGTARNRYPSSGNWSSTTNWDYNDLGTDTTADEYDNPSTVYLRAVGGKDGQNDTITSKNYVIFIAYGTVTESTTYTIIQASSGATQNASDNTNLTNYSLPTITQAATSDLNTSYLIMKETTAAAVTNAIPIYNTIIDAANSLQISVSSDGGSNWVNVDNTEIARLSTSSTALWWRATITRTDTSTNDKITETAIKYNFW